MSTLSAIIKDTPRAIADVRPGLPRELSKIISRCLAKDVEDRYQSAKDLRNDLRALTNELTSGEIEPISGWGERNAARATQGSASRRTIPLVAAVITRPTAESGSP